MRVDGKNDDARLKRFALQIATQMPENRQEAMRVLEYLKELVEWEDGEVSEPVLQLIG